VGAHAATCTSHSPERRSTRRCWPIPRSRWPPGPASRRASSRAYAPGCTFPGPRAGIGQTWRWTRRRAGHHFRRCSRVMRRSGPADRRLGARRARFRRHQPGRADGSQPSRSGETRRIRRLPAPSRASSADGLPKAVTCGPHADASQTSTCPHNASSAPPLRLRTIWELEASAIASFSLPPERGVAAAHCQSRVLRRLRSTLFSTCHGADGHDTFLLQLRSANQGHSQFLSTSATYF